MKTSSNTILTLLPVILWELSQCVHVYIDMLVNSKIWKISFIWKLWSCPKHFTVQTKKIMLQNIFLLTLVLFFFYRCKSLNNWTLKPRIVFSLYIFSCCDEMLGMIINRLEMLKIKRTLTSAKALIKFSAERGWSWRNGKFLILILIFLNKELSFLLKSAPSQDLLY